MNFPNKSSFWSWLGGTKAETIPPLEQDEDFIYNQKEEIVKNIDNYSKGWNKDTIGIRTSDEDSKHYEY